MMEQTVPTELPRWSLTAVYPSKKAWDELLRSIDEKAATAERLVTAVLERQARSA